MLSRLARGLWPAPLLSRPLSGLLLASLVLLAAVSVIVFAASFPFARKERAAGHLTPASGWSRVSARTFGVVRARHVEEGDIVELGDVLYAFASGAGLDERLSVEGKLLRDIAARRETLQARLGAIDAQIENDRAMHRDQRASLQVQVGHVEAEVEAREAGLAVARTQYGVGQRLRASNALSESALLELVDRTQSRAALVASKRRELAELRAVLDSQQAQLTRRELEREEARAGVEEQLLGLAMEESRIQVRDAGGVLAPRAGRVVSVRADEGDWVRPGDALLDVVPDAYRLEGRLFARSSAMGSIRVGQNVRIYLDAFPYERYGAQIGRVLAVSETTVGPRAEFAPDGPVRIDVGFPAASSCRLRSAGRCGRE